MENLLQEVKSISPLTDKYKVKEIKERISLFNRLDPNNVEVIKEAIKKGII